MCASVIGCSKKARKIKAVAGKVGALGQLFEKH